MLLSAKYKLSKYKLSEHRHCLNFSGKGIIMKRHILISMIIVLLALLASNLLFQADSIAQGIETSSGSFSDFSSPTRSLSYFSPLYFSSPSQEAGLFSQRVNLPSPAERLLAYLPSGSQGWQQSGELFCLLKTNKPVYRPGETVIITFTVANRSDFPVALRFHNSCCQPDLIVKNNSETVVWQWQPAHQMMCAQVMMEGSIAPGETRKFNFRWNQQDSQNMLVDPGLYQIWASWGGACAVTTVEIRRITKLYKRNNGDEIILNSGDVLYITLPSNISTGYSWELDTDSLDRSIIREIDRYYINGKRWRQLPGTPGYDVWVFQASGLGTTTIRLEYKQSWVDEASDIFEIWVTVE